MAVVVGLACAVVFEYAGASRAIADREKRDYSRRVAMQKDLVPPSQDAERRGSLALRLRRVPRCAARDPWRGGNSLAPDGMPAVCSRR